MKVSNAGPIHSAGAGAHVPLRSSSSSSSSSNSNDAYPSVQVGSHPQNYTDKDDEVRASEGVDEPTRHKARLTNADHPGGVVVVKRLGTGTVHAVVATESKQDQRRARAHAKKMEWQSNHATGHATGRGRDVRPCLVQAMVKRAHGIM